MSVGRSARRHGLPASLLALASTLLLLPAAPALAGTVHLSPQTPLTAANVYRHAQQSLARPGMLYQALVRDETFEGPYRYTTSIEEWVDARRNVAREQLVVTYGLLHPRRGRTHTSRVRTTTIITSSLEYSFSPTSPQVETTKPHFCYGPGLLSADVILGCPGSVAGPLPAVLRGRYAGRPAVILLGPGTILGEDSSTTATSRLYLDPATFLPLAKVTAGTVHLDKTYSLRGTTLYTHTFVPASSVADDFFDPASISYSDAGK